jgi:hypothetical protein
MKDLFLFQFCPFGNAFMPWLEHKRWRGFQLKTASAGAFAIALTVSALLAE